MSRQQQLTAKQQNKDDNAAKGKGRGRGKGKGRGRGGKCTAKSSETKTDESETRTQKQRKKKTKAVDNTDEWTWDDWSYEWGQHWWGEYEEGEYEGWDVAPKRWDEAAWHDGKESLHIITEVEEPKKKQKRKVEEMDVEKVDKTGTKQSKKAKVDDPGASIKVTGDKVTERNLADEMIQFALCFQDLTDSKTHDEIKFMLKESLVEPKDCKFNRYWTRNAVGVKSTTAGRDIAYFCFKADFEWPVEMALALKAAELLAPYTHYRFWVDKEMYILHLSFCIKYTSWL